MFFFYTVSLSLERGLLFDFLNSSHLCRGESAIFGLDLLVFCVFSLFFSQEFCFTCIICITTTAVKCFEKLYICFIFFLNSSFFDKLAFFHHHMNVFWCIFSSICVCALCDND